MAFPLKDIRFTTRRQGDGDPVLYPRVLRDHAALPKIGIAIGYFESMLGRERQELDTEVLVQFFADHKLARCVVAALSRSYRYRSPGMANVVTRASLRRLEKAGLDSPKLLRLRLYDHVNDEGSGFVAEAARSSTFEQLEKRLGLRSKELERLLYLDAEEHAILTRVGERPDAEDVAAQFNFSVMESLLRHAEHVDLRFSSWAEEVAAGVEALCDANGVERNVSRDRSGARLRLLGRSDALGNWSRHGRRVARTVIQLLERGRSLVGEGSARLILRDRRAILRLTQEALNLLAGAAIPDTGWQDKQGDSRTLLAALAASPREARAGWTIRRLPDPRAWASGVLVPDLLVQQEWRALLICAVRSAAHGVRLAPVAKSITSGEPVLFVGDADSLAPLQAACARTVVTPDFDAGAVADVLDHLPEPAGQTPRRSRSA